MTTYKDIKRQIADLEKKATELRKIEVAKVIHGIKSQIAEYDLTADDLFKGSLLNTSKNKRASTNPAKPANPPKYMDPKTGKTWTGHGKAPSWLAAAIKKGKKDDFLIAKAEEPRATKTFSKAPKTINAKIAKNATSAKPIAKVLTPTTKKATTAVIKKPAMPKKATAKPKMPATKKLSTGKNNSKAVTILATSNPISAATPAATEAV